MKKISRTACIACAALFIMILFAVSTSALSFRSGSMPDANNNPAETTVGDTTATDSSFMPDESTDQSADDSAVTSAPGTGEFFDDVTGSIDSRPSESAPNAPSEEGTAGADGKVEKPDSTGNVGGAVSDAVSDVVTGAEDMLTGKGGMWGIVLVIVVVAAVAVLLFALFARKK